MCEFTFGVDDAGHPSLGVQLTSVSSGVTVGAPWECPTVPPEMNAIVRTVNHFLRASPLRVYDQRQQSGESLLRFTHFIVVLK